MNMIFHITSLKKKPTIVSAFFIVLFYLSAFANASALTEQIERLDIENTQTLGELKAAVSVLKSCSEQAIAQQKYSYTFQQKTLAKAGASISQIMVLHDKEMRADQDVSICKPIFLTNRDVIKKILTLNEAIINDYQENRLDDMLNPLAFFKTPEWQQPQQLISLASYWLGWNGYYMSVVLEDSELKQDKFLAEAIDGFSRAFIDFEEDAVKAKSLFGRGVCYKQLREYKNALYDFKSVKDKVKKSDLLYVRALYEEGLIGYQTGNMKLSFAKLDEIKTDYIGKKIPDSIMIGIEQLRAKLLLSMLESGTKATKEAKKGPDDKYRKVFAELKQLAVTRGHLNVQFYRYVQENVTLLKHLTYDEIGPVACMAVGDVYFNKDEFDSALRYYLAVKSDASSDLKGRMDIVTFRVAYIYCKQKQWSQAIRYLEDFAEKYPVSIQVKQAVSLFYVAASNHYREKRTEKAYDIYISAIQTYLNLGGASPDNQSEARYQLGRYYQKMGQPSKALHEFIRVYQDSPNFLQAKYNVLKSYVEEIDALQKQGPVNSSEVKDIYQKGMEVMAACREVMLKQKERQNVKKMQPLLLLLDAKLQLYGSDIASQHRETLRQLERFEQWFPEEKALFMQASVLRIEAYHRLKMPQKAEQATDALIKTFKAHPEGYIALQNLSNRWFSQSTLTRRKGEKPTASHPASGALMLYRKLYRVSEKESAYEEYRIPIQLRMAELYMNTGQLQKAIGLYQKIREEDSQSADAVYGLGLLYEETGQWQAALNTWRKFSDGVKDGTKHWFEARYRTAKALFKLGEIENACNVVTMTIVLHPDLGDEDIKSKFSDFKLTICKGNAG